MQGVIVRQNSYKSTETLPVCRSEGQKRSQNNHELRMQVRINLPTRLHDLCHKNGKTVVGASINLD